MLPRCTVSRNSTKRCLRYTWLSSAERMLAVVLVDSTLKQFKSICSLHKLCSQIFFCPGRDLPSVSLFFPYISLSAPRADRSGFLHEQDARSCSRRRASSKRCAASLGSAPCLLGVGVGFSGFRV